MRVTVGMCLTESDSGVYITVCTGGMCVTVRDSVDVYETVVMCVTVSDNGDVCE